MKQYIVNFCLLVCILLFGVVFYSCNKTPDDDPPPAIPKPITCDTCLPDITTTGKGTFGCKVNGKIWLPKGAWGSPATRLIYNNN